MPATATDSLRLVRLDVQNFLRVEALTIEANGKHVKISGNNTSGKTSALSALWAALQGLPTRKASEPIHHGADKAEITLDLGEYTVKRTFTESGPKLVVKARDGRQITKPQQMLDGLLAKYSLDPVRFIQERPVDQIDEVLHVCQVVPPVEAVLAITSEQFPALPNESAARYIDRLAADHSGVLYVRRLEAGRIADQKRKATDEQRLLLEELGGALKEEEEPKSATALLAEMEVLQQKADEYRAAHAAAGELQNEQVGAEERLAVLLNGKAVEEESVRKLEAQLAEHRAKIAALNPRIEKGKEVVAEVKAEAEASTRAADAMSDPAPEIAALRARIATVEADNTKVAKRQLATEQLARLEQDLEAAVCDHKTRDGVLESVRHLRSQLLNGIDLGIDGLAVGMGELRLNDVPFSQASTAEQFRTALALAMKERPKLRLLRLDGAEALDSESKALVLELASARGFQCIMASVADTDGLRVEICEAEHG